jgi:hypothetical protein
MRLSSGSCLGSYEIIAKSPSRSVRASRSNRASCSGSRVKIARDQLAGAAAPGDLISRVTVRAGP